MSDSVLLVERDAPVAIVTLNRPDQMNALNAELRIALGESLAALEADPEIRAVVITGAGRAFCAGMDLKEIGGGSDGQTGYELSVAGQDAMRAGFENFSGPVIAAVNLSSMSSSSVPPPLYPCAEMESSHSASA